ncbi:MAG TPA: alpha-glucosidase family protein [Sphingomicrobium sp.]|nr:alpha-glucosidase family protein [Sphingomicrobium sp.]
MNVQAEFVSERDSVTHSDWWRGAVIYQIYPRSFADSNGDGIGDLPGITAKLDYVASLGVDAIWLSPFFTSPMKDFGYDVSDYLAVDPIFGTLDDFDALVERAHALGLKVVIDQVYCHTSDQHDWFSESRSDRSNPKADWYVWADAKPDGSPPSNWQSVFGGPAWEWDSRRGQYYLHNFLSGQPDLNLHNPAVQDALLEVAKFWLDRGVDGFRLDAINFAMHDTSLRDNPPAADDGKKRTRPFDFQQHIYNQSHPDIPQFLARLRALMDRYDARFTVAEIGGPDTEREMKAFTAGDGLLNTAYGFTFLCADALDPSVVRSAFENWPSEPGEPWPSWAFSNHDAPRHVSRWLMNCDQAKVARLTLMLLVSLRGNAFLYQGEELGLPQADVPFDRLRDPEALVNWPQIIGRDGARTPMPWNEKLVHGGFSPVEPWLPVDPRHAALAVDAQIDDPSSILAFARRMVALRKRHPALRTGTMKFIHTPRLVLAFEREQDGERLLCVFNLSDEACEWAPPLDGAEWTIIEATEVASTEIPVFLPPTASYIARR